MSRVRVKDYTGKDYPEKRGFTTKRKPGMGKILSPAKFMQIWVMMFRDFVDLYFEDMGHRLKESAIIGKRYMVDKKNPAIIRKNPVNEITPKDIP